MIEENKKKILEYAIAVNFLIDSVEYLLEDLESGEDFIESLAKIRRKIETVRKTEDGFKNGLGIER